MKRRPRGRQPGQQGAHQASRATARVTPTIHGLRKPIRHIVGVTLAVALKGGTSCYSGSATGPNFARPSAMADATPDSAVSRATRRAFLMAVAFERP